MRTLLLAAVLPLAGGCASSLNALFHRPVVEDSVQETLSTMSLSADRRSVIIRTEGPDRGRFCAEPPPDTATGLKSELEASLDAKAKRAEAEAAFKLGDKTDTTVVVLAERTPALDVFRSGVYAICQYHLNKAIDGPAVREMFLQLLSTFERTAGTVK